MCYTHVYVTRSRVAVPFANVVGVDDASWPRRVGIVYDYNGKAH
ncbi:hypothetical protein PC129_g18774 [Phytophthora cactorum]|uniref:Uncharacterized protein n=1 Tax=Phytophthora cactorum TaxID=29920 RepID=A0A8T1JXL2_9STRA|nr:hypothetical protein PC114_g21815 [Phytophthora cactorum]KAG2981794.1 hypothetical protein PC120_g24760 [Phytophthora cactorum]KAG3134939.1 hypothetical protein C6341_g21971 [Phytophthora cactorum]KAG3153742.1 hypothetical protein PC128_g22503 [Phytophthora cactorum]KAG3210220.1 hypothetical protein PC129_g18774 [Phytophthora cactorum]